MNEPKIQHLDLTAAVMIEQPVGAPSILEARSQRGASGVRTRESSWISPMQLDSTLLEYVERLPKLAEDLLELLCIGLDATPDTLCVTVIVTRDAEEIMATLAPGDAMVVLVTVELVGRALSRDQVAIVDVLLKRVRSSFSRVGAPPVRH